MRGPKKHQRGVCVKTIRRRSRCRAVLSWQSPRPLLEFVNRTTTPWGLSPKPWFQPSHKRTRNATDKVRIPVRRALSTAASADLLAALEQDIQRVIGAQRYKLW